MPHIYHWKHGWIPLDHEAALKKAHGSDSGARRALAQSHAGGHAHSSVITGTYGGGTHERGLQPVAAEHLPRSRNITAAFNPANRRFALLDQRPTGEAVAAGMPEHLAEHFHTQGHRIVGVHDDNGQAKIRIRDRSGNEKIFNANGSDKHKVDAPAIRRQSDEELAARLGSTNDPAEIDQIVGELDRRDRLEKQRQQAEARRISRDRARDTAYDKRLAAGEDPEQAYEDVYGVTVAKQRQQAAISALRGQGYQGAGFHELTATAYRDHVNEQMLAAEDGTRGNLLKGTTRANETRNIRRLFTDERYARTHASDELRTWWDQHGGFMTLADYRASVLGGHKQEGRHAWY